VLVIWDVVAFRQDLSDRPTGLMPGRPEHPAAMCAGAYRVLHIIARGQAATQRAERTGRDAANGRHQRQAAIRPDPPARDRALGGVEGVERAKLRPGAK